MPMANQFGGLVAGRLLLSGDIFRRIREGHCQQLGVEGADWFEPESPREPCQVGCVVAVQIRESEQIVPGQNASRKRILLPAETKPACSIGDAQGKQSMAAEEAASSRQRLMRLGELLKAIPDEDAVRGASRNLRVLDCFAPNRQALPPSEIRSVFADIETNRAPVPLFR